jgi:tetratricopeptide (TPR) repeat protein
MCFSNIRPTHNAKDECLRPTNSILSIALKTSLPKRFFCSALLALTSMQASAIGIGELTLVSRLGERVEAHIDVQLSKGEDIDDSCLSLAALKEGAVDNSNAFLQTGLTTRFNKTTGKIEIRSKRPLNEPAAEFSLNIQCKASVSSHTKVFAVLPEFAATTAPVAAVAPKRIEAPAPAVVAPKPAPSLTEPPQIQDEKPLAVEPSPSVPAKSKKAVAAAATPQNQAKSEFKLRLSGAQLDISRVGTLSANDREVISAQRKMLDEDDQTAHLLAMQYQMKAMSEEIQTIRQKLASLEAAKVEAKKAEPLVSSEIWQLILKLLAGLAALGLTVFGVRHYQAMKTRAPKLDQVAATEDTAIPPTPVGEPSLGIVHPSGSRQLQALQALQDELDMPISSSNTDTANKEEQTVLEEAELYAVYGHPDKAIRILQEFLEQFPKSENAWMLLLSIYSSTAQADEFERTSRKFLSHNKNSPQWKIIQALGRTLDNDNELYQEEDTERGALWLPSNSTKQRPIGDILIDLGYLSAQDMANCLGEFDPKQHGRFGNYLLTRRMINHSQLNEALLKQQSEDGTEMAADEAADWLAEDTTPNEVATAEEVEHPTSDAHEHVQDKAFPIDFVIDDKQRFTDEAVAAEESTAEEVTPPTVEDKAQPLAFHIDFDLPSSDKPKDN